MHISAPVQLLLHVVLTLSCLIHTTHWKGNWMRPISGIGTVSSRKTVIETMPYVSSQVVYS
jgi:hypothetical protein